MGNTEVFRVVALARNTNDGGWRSGIIDLCEALIPNASSIRTDQVGIVMSLRARASRPPSTPAA
jgi:hypothetical protein